MGKLTKEQIQSIVGEKISMPFYPQQDYNRKWVWEQPCYINDYFKWKGIEPYPKGCTYTLRGISNSEKECLQDYALECVLQCIGLINGIKGSNKLK